MKATAMAALATFFLAALCAFAPGAASAQGANVYAVSGVYVDQTAADAATAQQGALSAAERIGYERLIRRLTLPDELSARGIPQLDAGAIERLVLSVDVEDQRRSATRYIGRLTVRFDPAGVRTLLQQNNLRLIDTRTAPILVVPLAANDVTAETATLWRQVWSQGGFEDELAPLTIAPEALTGPPAWEPASPFAQSASAASVLYATLRVQGGAASASLVEIDANTRRDRGEVTALLNGNDDASLRATLFSLAEQASSRVQNDWKARVSGGGGQRGRISTSALYQNERQWEQIKGALEGAAQTLISEIRIEAVGREGALVSFSFVGERSQLAAELARRGISLQESAQGPVLRVAAQ